MTHIAKQRAAVCPILNMETCSTAGRLSSRVLRPTGRVQAPALVVLHGIARNAQELTRLLKPYAEQWGRTIIIPHFNERAWPSFQRPCNVARPDLALLALLDRVTAELPDLVGPVELFGHSGGAQLAHRVAMLFPHRIARLYVAAAGWYCLPDYSMPYPYALGAGTTTQSAKWTRRKAAALKEFLRIPVRVYVGSEDVQRDDALRKTPELDKQQGRNRRTRAHTYTRALNQAAATHGLVPQAKLIELPGCDHDVVQAITKNQLATMLMEESQASLASMPNLLGVTQ